MRAGSAVLVAEWAPGSDRALHRTLSLDIGVMAAGESTFRSSTTPYLFN